MSVETNCIEITANKFYQTFHTNDDDLFELRNV